MPSFDPKQNSDFLPTPKEPNFSGGSSTKPRGSTSSRKVEIYNISNPFLKKASNQESSTPLIFGLGTSLKSNVGADLTTDSSKNKTVIGQSAGINQNIIEQITQDSEENLNPDVTKSATAPEKVVQDIIKKQNQAEASYNYIPPSFETFLLQNGKNKVLFNFTRPTFSYNLKLVRPVDKPTQIDISNFSLLFYKTNNKPSSIEEMTTETNLFKELVPAKKELSIIDFLDVNVDYYFYLLPEQNLIDKISSLIVEEFDLSLGDFNYTTAGEKGILSDYIYRVRVIKDGDLYFLEKEALNLKEIKDTKKTKTFFGTVLAEPKYSFVNTTAKNFSKTNSVLPFVASDSTFDSGENYPYIKLRFKSKKSNRKFDVNLKYTISKTDPINLTESQIGQVRTEKYTKLRTEEIKISIFGIKKEDFDKFKTEYYAITSNYNLTNENFKKFIDLAIKEPPLKTSPFDNTARFILFSLFQKLQITFPKINWISKDFKTSGSDIKPTINFQDLGSTIDFIPLSVGTISQKDIEEYLQKFGIKDDVPWKNISVIFLENLTLVTNKIQVNFDNFLNKILFYLEDYKVINNRANIIIENDDSFYLKLINFTNEDLEYLKNSNPSDWKNYSIYKDDVVIILDLLNKLKQSVVIDDIVLKQ